ncbi:M20 family metallopeptidase [Thermodesulfobacteriota bacterium]
MRNLQISHLRLWEMIAMTTPESFIPDDNLISWIRDIRRTIHENPELSFQEYETASFIAAKLDELKIPYRTGIGKTGIIATLGNSGHSPGIALRADIDALPLQELTGLPFASRKPGIMHACGHDGHIAILLGAAALLKKISLAGHVVLLFQPAEESEGGAQHMIHNGALDGVDVIFSGHIDRHFRVGEIAIEPGQICANTDSFIITVTGRGGHAAKPHETVDSIVVASMLVMSIQTLVSREVNPSFPTVVTVGKIQGGTAPNVIADQAILEGTIRTTHREVRQKILAGLQRMVKSIGELYLAETTLQLIEGYPPVINDPFATKIALRAGEETVGKEGVKGLPYPSLGGEDFSYYLEKIPGCFVRFGAMKEELIDAPAHSPRFDFNEEVLPVAAQFLARVTVNALKYFPPRG